MGQIGSSIKPITNVVQMEIHVKINPCPFSFLNFPFRIYNLRKGDEHITQNLHILSVLR